MYSQHVLIFHTNHLTDVLKDYNLFQNARIFQLAVSLVYESLVDTHCDLFFKDKHMVDSIVYQHYLELVQDGALPSGIDGQYYQVFQYLVKALFNTHAFEFIQAIRQSNPKYLPSRIETAWVDQHSLYLKIRVYHANGSNDRAAVV